MKAYERWTYINQLEDLWEQSGYPSFWDLVTDTLNEIQGHGELNYTLDDYEILDMIVEFVNERVDRGRS